MSDEPEVRAAGAAVFTNDDGGPRWAVIHRPRYDDWSLPKGKLDPGEDFEQAAVREVAEEIGVHGALGAELPSTRYRDNKDRPKVVRYWLMETPEVPAFEPNDEVDDVRWLTTDEALAALTYQRDLDLIHAAVELLRESEAA
jgi:8-oxo-dGTP diphosphatase